MSEVEFARELVDYAVFLERLAESLDFQARAEFREPEKICLIASMRACGMKDYPPVAGEPDLERCSGEMICDRCGKDYYSHPADWRVIGYGNVPFLNVLCDGRRVKL